MFKTLFVRVLRYIPYTALLNHLFNEISLMYCLVLGRSLKKFESSPVDFPENKVWYSNV